MEKELKEGQVIFFSHTEEHWDYPFVKKRHHDYDTRSVILRGTVTETKENQFKALLFGNNGFEKDGQEFVFSKGSLLSNQDVTILDSLGKWKIQISKSNEIYHKNKQAQTHKFLKNEIEFCEEFNMPKNDKGQYIFYSQDKTAMMSVASILHDYKEFLIKNKIVILKK